MPEKLRNSKLRTDVEYYNSALKYARRPLERSPWRHLYLVAVGLIPEQSKVLDLGCGTGRFAKALLERTSKYIGVDFAEKRIEMARQYVPEFWFIQSDFYSPAIIHLFKQTDIVVLLEVLEHIEHDLTLLEKIPLGKTVILAVPNYDEVSHVRYFTDLNEVKARYSKMLNFNYERALSHAEGCEIFLLRGIRR